MTRIGLTLIAAIALLMATGGSAKAQRITVKSGGWVVRQDGKSTTQPYGDFSTARFPGTGGSWRVKVEYGESDDKGKFVVYNKADNISPDTTYTIPTVFGGGGQFVPWHVSGT